MKQEKKKLYVTAIAVTLCLALLISATYAWIVLSRAPEAVGMETNIGANGGLEMALLSSETYQDPSLITAKLGDSTETAGVKASNLSWGNIVDLSDGTYGLSSISLLPASLNLQSGPQDTYYVNGSYLSIPEFGADGRISSLIPNTVSAVYAADAFKFSSDRQTYGVRAIGTANNLPTRLAALVTAKASVSANRSAARNAAKASLEQYGAGVMDIFVKHYINHDNVFNGDDVAVLKNLTNAADTSLDYIEYALLQVNIAANYVSGDLSSRLADCRSKVSTAQSLLTQLSGGEYSWQQISNILDCLVSPDQIFIGEGRAEEWSELSMDTVITLAPGSGVFADIADFTGNYQSSVTYQSKYVKYTTKSLQSPSHLEKLQTAVSSLSETGIGIALTTPITDTYGFAVDLAFRTNSENNALMLKTFEDQRIYPDDTNALTQGDGSYMVFERNQSNYDDHKLILLMDAVRVGFIDTKGELLGVAKLNTSNWLFTQEDEKEGIKAYLYLYESNVSSQGKLLIGERQDEEDAVITPLARNIPTVISTIVWLEGDEVDNTMATTSKDCALCGKLNLQFASQVELNPANISSIDR